MSGQIQSLPKLNKSIDESIDDKDSTNIKVLTLNCWGLYGVSKLRRPRMNAIGKYLAESDFDIVLLEEVWCHEDFELLQMLCSNVYPFSHFFDHGIIGSGTCIFTKYRLKNANFHEFAMNGYPVKFWHGDWFAAKGLGVCQLEINGFEVTVFVSHYHAEYDPGNDIYLGHRVIHALESAQWLNMTSAATDLTLYCGDFNTEPNTVAYRLLRGIVPLNDSWVEHTGDVLGGETSQTPENTFTPNGVKAQRIDYIMYQAGPGLDAETVDCWLPLPNRVPDTDYSYSDHEAVAAVIKVSKPGTFQSGPEFRRSLSVNNRAETERAVKDAIRIIDKSLKTVEWDQTKYIFYTFFLLLLLVLTFIPSAFVPESYFLISDLAFFMPRFGINVFIVIFFLMASLFNKREKNALIGTKKELQLLIDQVLPNNES